MATTTPLAMELALMCKNQQEIITLLRNKGIVDMFDLSEVTDNDIMSLDIKDIVVRRRLVNYILKTSQPLPNIQSLEDLCRKHSRTLNILNKAGVRTLNDLDELEPEDIADLRITHIPILRRINKYMTRPPKPVVEEKKHTRKLSNAPLSIECTSPKSPSVTLRGGGFRRQTNSL